MKGMIVQQVMTNTSYRPMTAADLGTARFSVKEDLRESRHRTEDGDRCIYSAFGIEVEADSGHRWASPEVFAGTIEHDEDGFPHACNRAARAEAEAFLAKVSKDPTSALSWEPTDPCYGSGAWDSDAEWRSMDDEEQAGYIQRHGAPFGEE